MKTLRAIVATLLFFIGIFLLIRLFVSSFQWMTLIVALLCFVLAYFIWPSKKQGQRHEDNWFLDVMEILIELPVDILIWIFRLIGHLFKRGDGIDIDF